MQRVKTAGSHPGGEAAVQAGSPPCIFLALVAGPLMIYAPSTLITMLLR